MIFLVIFASICVFSHTLDRAYQQQAANTSLLFLVTVPSFINRGYNVELRLKKMLEDTYITQSGIKLSS